MERSSICGLPLWGGTEEVDMKVVSSIILSCFVFAAPASSAFADDVSLAPGKPAGVHNAQFGGGNGIFIVTGAALIGIAVVLATSGNGVSANNTGSSSVSTGSTTP
jgi:hypothetical protein